MYPLLFTIVLQLSTKYAQPSLAVPIGPFRFLLHVFKNYLFCGRGKLRRCKHLFDEGCRKARALVLSTQYRPSRTSRQTKTPGLLIERSKTSTRKCLPKLSHFGRLHRLQTRTNGGRRPSLQGTVRSFPSFWFTVDHPRNKSCLERSPPKSNHGARKLSVSRLKRVIKLGQLCWKILQQCRWFAATCSELINYERGRPWGRARHLWEILSSGFLYRRGS